MRGKILKYDIVKIFSAVTSILMIVLTCIFMRSYPKYIVISSLIIFASLGVFISGLDVIKHESFLKACILALITLSIVLVAFIIMERAGLLEKIQDVDALLEFIRSTKQLGVIVFIAFVILQLIFLPLPSAVTAFIGSVLYGPLLSFIFMSIGTVIGSIICFSLGKVFGKKLAVWIMGKDKMEKYADLVNKKGKFVFILMIVFPLFPDDILCIIAGITNMSYKFFIFVICTIRVAMTALICFFMDGTIIPFTGWGVPVWIGIFALSIVLLILISKFKNRIMSKTKNSKT